MAHDPPLSRVTALIWQAASPNMACGRVACAASFMARRISGNAKPVMKPSVPCSMSKPPYSAPRPLPY
eukprot:4000309-Prymnesium_polylepis.2